MCLPNYHEVNSLAVFLTGAIAHQEGVATAIYISFPTQSIDDQNFIYIGFISNQKPSAFFRLNQLKNLEPYQGGLQVAVSNAYSNSNLQPQSTAFLYFSHEPISEIESKVSVNESEKRSSTTNLLHRKQFQIQNLIENFYNYATSFVTSTSNLKASFSNPIDDQKLWIPVDCFLVDNFIAYTIFLKKIITICIRYLFKLITFSIIRFLLSYLILNPMSNL